MPTSNPHHTPERLQRWINQTQNLLAEANARAADPEILDVRRELESMLVEQQDALALLTAE
ncbi:MAG: hypothetical protein DRQ37_04660 [Gammaproteobacteria bacterium]|nr:MAG: hypothetical protein DRQ37_04660 [Gammaproteobacteria bacterium]